MPDRARPAISQKSRSCAGGTSGDWGTPQQAETVISPGKGNDGFFANHIRFAQLASLILESLLLFLVF